MKLKDNDKLVRKVKGEQERVNELYALLKGYPGLLRVERFTQYHFRLYLTPQGSPYVYRADYWPRTGKMVLLDDDKRHSEFAANPRQVIRRLTMYAGLQEAAAAVRERYG